MALSANRRSPPRPAASTWLRRLGELAIVSAVAAGAQPSPEPDALIQGESLDDGFGFRVAAAGDVNRDGVEDYLVGADGVDDAGLAAGKVYLFHGPLTGRLQAASADATITGEAELDGLGNSVAGVGDVNDDGFDDILLGARSNDAAGTQAGRAYLFYGPLGGSLEASNADAILSGDPFDELGWSVAGVGDVDDDGFDDVLVGAWMADIVGEAHLFLGPLAGPLTVADADATVSGVIFSEELGYDVAGGDLDDDGVPDLILGAPRPPLGGEDPGSVYVFFGPVTGSHAASAADVIVLGEHDNDELGISVAAGDVDGDGADDLIVGARQLFSDGPGRVYVFHGPLSGVLAAGDADAILLGETFPAEGGHFGAAVAALGDTNGDRIGDVLVGAPFAEAAGVRSGRAYLFHGPLAGTVSAGDADRVFTGSEFDLLGTSVAAAADDDGDGLRNALVGAPRFFGENGFGYAALYRGSATIFADGFESGDTSAWTQTVP